MNLDLNRKIALVTGAGGGIGARISATLVDEGTFRIKTKNIAAFTIALPPGPAPLDKTHPPRVVIDDQDPELGLVVRHIELVGDRAHDSS